MAANRPQVLQLVPNPQPCGSSRALMQPKTPQACPPRRSSSGMPVNLMKLHWRRVLCDLNQPHTSSLEWYHRWPSVQPGCAAVPPRSRCVPGLPVPWESGDSLGWFQASVRPLQTSAIITAPAVNPPPVAQTISRSYLSSCHSAMASYMARILATGVSSVMASTLGAAR